MEVLWMPGGVRTEIHLDGARTGGAFCLLRDETPPGWSLPMHCHAGEAETIHVLEGTFECVVGNERLTVGAGETLHVPAGTPHSGTNVGEGTARRVLVFSPAGIEDFFRAAGSASEDDVADMAAVLRLAGKHGWRFG